MEFEALAIPDVVLIRPTVYGDARGFFMETWRRTEFEAAGISHGFVQDNHSRSSRHVLRGLHYQVGTPQGKLVRVVAGEVFDVAVDLRSESPDFGRWVGQHLSAEGHEMLWVPPGFAHGFLVLSEHADLVYRSTEYYAPETERCVRWDDADLGIDWPIPAGVTPTLSDKDAAAVAFADAEVFEQAPGS